MRAQETSCRGLKKGPLEFWGKKARIYVPGGRRKREALMCFRESMNWRKKRVGKALGCLRDSHAGPSILRVFNPSQKAGILGEVSRGGSQ